MISLKNQFIMPPIKTGWSDGNGNVTEKHLKFYERRAKYLGGIIFEPFYLAKNLRELPTQIGVDSDDKIEELKKLSNLVHKYDTKAIAHLNHPGKMANPKIPDNYFISPSAIPCSAGGPTPKEMDDNDFENVKKLFINAVKRLEKANFDIIEIQFGHGYLLAQFLSPLTNKREDRYGGSFEKRVSFPLELIETIHDNTKLPIIARISASDLVKNGLSIGDIKKFVKLLEPFVDAIHVSSGSACETPPWYFQHMFIPKGKTWEFAKEIKAITNKPIIVVGQINTFEDLDKLKNEFDFISIGRAMVADPDFIAKYFKKIDEPLRPCMNCLDGCLGGVKGGRGLNCVMNPFVGREELEPYEKASKAKNIAIVGGGPAGVMSAIFLKQRGHNITLFEKDSIGGQFNLAPLPPGKKNHFKAIKYFNTMLDFYNIDVKQEAFDINHYADFDFIVLATGSKPKKLPIEGLNKYYWAEILEEKNTPRDKNILIVGGGVIGLEVASHLIEYGNHVIIVEFLPELGSNMEIIEKKLLLKKLQNHENVEIYTNCAVKRVDGKQVFVEKREGGTLEFYNIDHIVITAGLSSNNELETKLKGKIPYAMVGDAKEIGKLENAIKSALDLALSI